MLSEMILSFALVASGGYITYLHLKKKKAGEALFTFLNNLYQHCHYEIAVAKAIEKVSGEVNLDQPLAASKLILLAADLDSRARVVLSTIKQPKES